MVDCDADENTEGPHHSDDLIEVYTGRVDPDLLCGFHAMKRGLL